MKRVFFISAMVLFLAGCGGKEGDKTARLSQLKKERDRLTEEIVKLEKELTPNDVVQATFVKVDVLTKQTFEHYIEVQGRIDGNENIAVS
ncbi:MAG: efflux RND transporter periplasmic adaptor subunit, partial [Bacteroidetes bacterium]|nr:efflux RND transporter periplasmic adaptor subunit [Bacteroidota bacterium]